MAIRAVRKNVRIRLAGVDLLGVSGDLMPLKNTTEARETALKLACPDCAADGTPTLMDQFYVGKTCGHVPTDGRPGYKTGDCKDKVRMEGKKAVLVTEAELATLKTEAEKDDGPLTIDLTVEGREAVDAATYPAGNVYWFEPDRATSSYTIFCELATDAKYALVGTLTLRGVPQLVQLVPHRGGIVLTQLLRPTEVYTYEAEKPAVKDVEAQMAAQLVAALANPEFDAEAYSNGQAKAIRELIEAKLSGAPIVTAANEARNDKPEAEIDMTIALGAALAAIKASKGV